MNNFPIFLFGNAELVEEIFGARPVNLQLRVICHLAYI